MRLFGKGPEQGRIYRRRPGAYAIIVADNQLLVTHQSSPNPEYQLPGGGIDPKESVFQALHREVMEETGSSVSIERRLGVYQTYTYMAEYNMWANKICHIFLCRHGRKLREPTEPHHTSELMEFEDALSALSSQGDRFFLQRYLGL